MGSIVTTSTTEMNRNKKMKKSTKKHQNFSSDDFAYLSAKGWSESEIVARWNEEAAAGKSACGWSSHFASKKLAATVGGL